MAENSAIQWTDNTWNPWRGCTKISPGCANCYMFTDQRRYGRDPAEVVRTKTWGDPFKWQKAAEAAGRTELVFTCSWSDWFHKDADPWREEAWAVVKKCKNLTFQILTKRADRIKDNLPSDWGQGYPNVWLGVSVENQKCAGERIPKLLGVPAAVRFLSCEPLLGPVNLSKFHIGWSRCPSCNQASDPNEEQPLGSEIYCSGCGNPNRLPVDGHHLHWVIVGGESGHEARTFRQEWARSLRDQCKAAGIALFMKQMGPKNTITLYDSSNPDYRGTMESNYLDRKGGDWSEWPQDLRVREFPAGVTR